jgi:hypothetical protein
MERLSVSTIARLLSVLTAIVLAVIRTAGQDSSNAAEFDPSVWVLLELNKHSRLDFYTGRERSEELDSSKWKVGVGASIRVRPIFNLFGDDDPDKKYTLVLGTVFEHSKTSEAGATRNENKIALDAWGRWAFKKPKILITDRNRVEFRWVNGDYHIRYRNWLFAERPFKINKIKLTPFAGTEPFWDQRYGKWNLFRFMAGARVPLMRRTFVDVFYVREHCLTCATLNTDVLGLNFFIPLRLKKR